MRRRSFLRNGAAMAVTAAAAQGCAGDSPDLSRSAAEAEDPPLGAFVDAAGEQVHYWDRGRGAPVVLIHGAGGNLRDWTFDIAPRLAVRYRVIAFDRPGFGYTTRRAEADDPASQARILRAAAEALGIDCPVVVGHSYGGSVALAWALDAQQPPRGVVSVAGVAMPYASALGEVSRAIGLNELTTVIYQRYLRASFDAEALGEYLARVFRPQQPPEGYADYIGAPLSLRDGSLRANAADLAALHGALGRMAPRYPQLEMPVEALHGTADRTVMPAQSRALAAAAPRGRLTPLDGLGHMPHHFRPAAPEQAIGRILAA